MKNYFLLIGFSFLLFSCDKKENDLTSTSEEPVTLKTLNSTSSTHPNILLVIADDMGLDATPGYSEGSVKPNMPNL